MILLDTALRGTLSSGPPLSDDVRHLLADVALHCLAATGDPFFLDQDDAAYAQCQEALATLSQAGAAAATKLLDPAKTHQPTWMRHILAALQSLDRVITLYRVEERNDAIPATEDLCRLILMAAELNVLAMQHHAQAVARVAIELESWLNIHTSYGVLHYSILRGALSQRVLLQGKVMSPAEKAQLYEDTAYQLLDKTDELNAEHRGTELFSAILVAAHLTLPMYATARRFLNLSREERRGGGLEVGEDLQKEIGVAEEHRVTCIETLSAAGVFQIDQVINTAALHARRGEPFGPVLLAASRDVSSRIPHYPVRLRKAWQALAKEADQMSFWPYGSTRGLQIMGMLAYVMQQRLKTLFTDTHTLNMVVIHQRHSGFPLYQSYYSPPTSDVSHLHELPFDETTLQEEVQSAFEIGNTLRVDGEVEQAFNAYETAFRLKHGEYSLLAALHLSELHREQGHPWENTEAYLRDVMAANHSEYSAYAAMRLGTLLAEREDPEAEIVLQATIDLHHREHSKQAAFSLASIKFRRKEFDQAEVILRQLLDSDPSQKGAPAADLLGHIELEQGNYQEAATIFADITASLDPEIAGKAWVNLGYALFHQGNHAGAEMAFQRATESDNPQIAATAVHYLNTLQTIQHNTNTNTEE